MVRNPGHVHPNMVPDGPELVPDGPELVPDGPELVPDGPELVPDGPELDGKIRFSTLFGPDTYIVRKTIADKQGLLVKNR